MYEKRKVKQTKLSTCENIRRKIFASLKHFQSEEQKLEREMREKWQQLRTKETKVCLRVFSARNDRKVNE